MEVNTISNEVEKEDYNTCPYGGMIELNDKEKNTMPKTRCPKNVFTDEKEENTKLVTPKTETSYNVRTTHPQKLGLHLICLTQR